LAPRERGKPPAGGDSRGGTLDSLRCRGCSRRVSSIPLRMPLRGLARPDAAHHVERRPPTDRTHQQGWRSLLARGESCDWDHSPQSASAAMADATVGPPADPSRCQGLGPQDRSDRLGDAFPARSVPFARGDGRIIEPTPRPWGVRQRPRNDASTQLVHLSGSRSAKTTRACGR
jgi:hypothetical protein